MNSLFIRATLVAGLAILAGCSTLPPIEDPKAANHIISIGRDGQLEAVLPNQPILLNRDARGLSVAEDQAFEHILNGIQQFPVSSDGYTDVLLFVHGGLNTEAGALERAMTLYKDIMRDPVNPMYPVFVNWRSGPVSTYTAHLSRFRQGEISKTAPLTSPIYLLTDLAQSLVNTPKSWLVTGEHMLDTTLQREDRYLENFRGDHNVYFSGNQGDFNNRLRALKWVATSPARLVTTPFTYTMAKPAWDVMLRRTNTPFYTPKDLENREHDVSFGIKPGKGALYDLLRDLQALDQQPDVKLRITLIGHSMGAIIVNRMLRLPLDLDFSTIVHMASADSINNLTDSLIPYLATHPQSTFYNLALHPENEDREMSANGLTPSGSLLVWIDNMFTSPETVLDRRSGRWTNLERALPLIPADIREQMFFKIFGINEDARPEDDKAYITEPQEHGDFDNLRFWRKQTWYR